MMGTMKMRATALTIMSALVLYTAGYAQTGKTGVKVGVGETIITPQKNMQMAGFARSQVSTGIHDDLHARSLTVMRMAELPSASSTARLRA